MLRSMTGFGASDLATAAGRYTVEARSLNHRFLEIIVRLPRELAPWKIGSERSCRDESCGVGSRLL